MRLNWLERLSIRTKVSVIALIGVAGFVAFLSLNYRMSSRVQGDLVSILQNDLAMLRFINELQVEYSGIDNGFQTAELERDTAVLAETLRRAGRLSDRFYTLRQENPQQREGLEQLQQGLRDYVQAATIHAEAVLRGEEAAAEQVRQQLTRANQARMAYADLQKVFITRTYELFTSRITGIQEREREVMSFGISIGVMASLMLLLASLVIIRMIREVLDRAVNVADRIASGDLEQPIDADGDDESARLLRALEVMRDALLIRNRENREREDAQRALGELNELMRGDQPLEVLAERVLCYLADQLKAVAGAIYVYRNDALHWCAGYANNRDEDRARSFLPGESLVGQCARDRRLLCVDDVPAGYLQVLSGTGNASPGHLVLMPLLADDVLQGVIELGSFQPFDDKGLACLRASAEGIGIAVHSAQSRQLMAVMLQQSSEQAAQLRKQQQELEKINQDLALQTDEILRKNQELERSRKVLVEKSEALEASGRYKTQFLSMMSHELRTPLNSILILSQALMDNRTGSLSPRDVEHAGVIHASGADLLALINDILDLSKVEEGKMELVFEDIAVQEMADELGRRFTYIAQNKGLSFAVNVDQDVPARLNTDSHRLNQILKNFISNALKFTDQGGVTVTVQLPRAPFLPVRPDLLRDNAWVVVVRDTGLGVPKDKQEVIFEAFCQADGTTSRKFGGTGLGLTISRELAGLLGGEVQVYSEGEGKGSAFAVILPLRPLADQRLEEPVADMFSFTAQRVNRILVVEDDRNFARILHELIEEAGLSCDIVGSGSDALVYLDHYVPQAIILDVSLPDMPGWEVVKKVRSIPGAAGTPVHVISALPARREAESIGAREFFEKPVSQADVAVLLSHIKEEIAGAFSQVLIVEDSIELHGVIAEQFSAKGIEAEFVVTAAEALDRLRRQSYECLIVDLHLPDADGLDLLQQIRTQPGCALVPVIVFTAEELVPARETAVRQVADQLIIKSAFAMDRLLDATQQFLRHVGTARDVDEKAIKTEHLPAEAGTIAPAIAPVAMEESALAGCKVLLVDDDVRNIYAMTAMLEDFGMDVVPAFSGAEALARLAQQPVDVVLMDIMMPEMDGYEAIRRIRALPSLQALPVVALTAKALQEDCSDALKAGATAWLTKPADQAQLQAVISSLLGARAS